MWHKWAKTKAIQVNKKQEKAEEKGNNTPIIKTINCFKKNVR